MVVVTTHRIYETQIVFGSFFNSLNTFLRRTARTFTGVRTQSTCIQILTIVVSGTLHATNGPVRYMPPTARPRKRACMCVHESLSPFSGLFGFFNMYNPDGVRRYIWPRRQPAVLLHARTYMPLSLNRWPTYTYIYIFF